MLETQNKNAELSSEIAKKNDEIIQLQTHIEKESSKDKFYNDKYVNKNAENDNDLAPEIKFWINKQNETAKDYNLILLENEKLKAELAQSVKLSCKVGDVVHFWSKYERKVVSAPITEISIKKDNILVHIGGYAVFSMIEFGIFFYENKEEAEHEYRNEPQE